MAHEPDDDLSREIQTHLDTEAEDLVAGGMSERDARAVARQRFGNVTSTQEQYYESRRTMWFEDLRRDVGYALRALRRTPGFTIVALLTLGLGIGAATALFTVVDSVLLRPLPFPEADRLVMVRSSRLGCCARVSAEYFDAWRQGTRSFEGMAAWREARANLIGEGDPIEVPIDQVTPAFFEVLGTRPLVGRTFSAMSLGAIEPEAVLSYGFWQERYGGDPSVLGRPVTLDGEVRTIVGVMPREFSVPTLELAESPAEMWIPVRLEIEEPYFMGGFLQVVGRLTPEASTEVAVSELTRISQQIETAYPPPADIRGWTPNVVSVREAAVGRARLGLLVLFGAVGALLVIACLNVATLRISRQVARQSEFALRRALGASTSRLLRLSLTEGLVLAALGGLLGLVVAAWGTSLLVSGLPSDIGLQRLEQISVDASGLTFALVLIALVASVFGLLASVGAESTRQLPRDARAVSPPAGGRLGATLIVGEVALTLALLVAGGLLVRSLTALSQVEAGFQAEQVLTLRTTLPTTRYDSAERIRLFGRQLLERTAGLPEVDAVGFANYLPMSQFGVGGPRFEGITNTCGGGQQGSWVSVVGGDFFEAMGIPLLRGRLFQESDTAQTRPVFLIDDRLAGCLWPNENPSGRRVTWQGDDGVHSGEIIGVVGSVHWRGVARAPQPMVYAWFPQAPDPQLVIVARTSGRPTAMTNVLRAQVAAIDPGQPVADVRPLTDLVAADLAQPRLLAVLLGTFALTALLLAALGLYGVMAFHVAQRVREIGVRMALGARRRQVLWAVFSRGARLTTLGILLGAMLALASQQLLTGLLYGVTSTDATTFIAVVGFLGVVATGAILIPARRATKVDPMVALRCE